MHRVCLMKTRTVMYFTEKEEEFVSLLNELGFGRPVAQVLVFLANVPEATSRDIERGTDLRQPEVSIAMNHFRKRGWVGFRESKAESKGRPIKIYKLTKPIGKIMDLIEKEKKEEAHKRLEQVQKLREYIS